MHEATRFIHDRSEELRAEYRASEALGKLSDRTVEILKESGGLRLLLSKDLGGYESHPRDFLEWIIAVGTYHPSAGWVAGVCGVHPFEFSVLDPRVREEVYGEDPDTMVSSPYAPFGRAKPVEGGYLFSGRWPYSTGTDHSDWVILGGIVDSGETGEVSARGTAEIRHFILPKDGSYEIVEGSWEVMGLSGTGSKDVMMKDVFVPEYRTVVETDMEECRYAEKYRPGVPLYRMRFMSLFPAAIVGSTLGIAAGLLRELRTYMETRVNAVGLQAKADPYLLAQYGLAAAEVEASIKHVLSDMDDLFDWVSEGNAITPEQRILVRRNQAAASARSISAVNALYRLSGSQAVQRRHLVEGFFRDLQVASSHYGNATNPLYHGWALHDFGQDIPDTVFY